MHAAVAPAASTTATPRARAASTSAGAAPEAANRRRVPARARPSATTAATVVRLISAAVNQRASDSKTGRIRSSAVRRFASEFA